jgi:glycosyltransferase involved in cell wall biosynthesis
MRRLFRVGIEYLGRALAHHAEAFTVQTNGMKEVLIKQGYDEEKISVIGNILDPDFEESRKRDRKIIYVGRLVENKAPHMVVRGFENLPSELRDQWTLHIYGHGPMKSKIEQIIDDSDLDDVVLERVPYPELPKVYAASEVLVHSSQYTEPFSRTWLEAMASETAIVCSDNPSSRDSLAGVAEFYHPFDVCSLTESLASVLSNPVRRREMRREGRNRIAEYRPERIIPKYIDVYEQTIT